MATDFEKDIEGALQTLYAGGLILYPTDTIWGIGCDATNKASVQKIFELKKRAESKSLIVLVATERDLLTYISGLDPAVFDFLKTVQKPTTVIYNGAIGLAENLVAADGSVAIRVVNELFCRHLIKRFRKPLVSTSANISGLTAPRFFDEIDGVIKEGVDYTVKYRQDEKKIQEPSAIINGIPKPSRQSYGHEEPKTRRYCKCVNSW